MSEPTFTPPRLFGHAALGRPDARQLPRRDEAVGRHAEMPAGSRPSIAWSICTRSRQSCWTPTCSAAIRASCARASSRAESTRKKSILINQSQVPETRATRLDLQLRRADGLDGPHDPVEGQGRRKCRGRVARPSGLPRAHGCRHPDLPRNPRPRRRGPETAPSNSPATFAAEVQPRLRAVDFFPITEPVIEGVATRVMKPAGRHQEDVEVRSLGPDPHQH